MRECVLYGAANRPSAAVSRSHITLFPGNRTATVSQTAEIVHLSCNNSTREARKGNLPISSEFRVRKAKHFQPSVALARARHHFPKEAGHPCGSVCGGEKMPQWSHNYHLTMLWAQKSSWHLTAPKILDRRLLSL